MKERKTIHDSDDGDSPLYVGIKYLGLVADQMGLIRDGSKQAYELKGSSCFLWLNELRIFYDLIASKTDVHFSTKEVELFEFKLVNSKMEKIKINIQEKDKYEKWFDEIEKMIERNLGIISQGYGNVFKTAQYQNDKKILVELGRCTRELFRDANAKHLIMPEGLQDMKELVKNEWLDREAKKEF